MLNKYEIPNLIVGNLIVGNEKITADELSNAPGVQTATLLKIKDRHFLYEVVLDEDCPSPLKNDTNLRMAIFHPRFINPAKDDIPNPDALFQYEKETKAFVVPVEAYIHSSIALAVRREGNFPDRQWDVTKGFGALIFERSYIEGVLKWKRLNPKRKQVLLKTARAIIQLYSDWMNGDCFGYILSEVDAKTGEKKKLNSCFGFIGEKGMDENLEAYFEDLFKAVD